MVIIPTKIVREAKNSVLDFPNFKYLCAVAYETILATPNVAKRDPIRAVLMPTEFA